MVEFKEVLPCGAKLGVIKYGHGALKISLTDTGASFFIQNTYGNNGETVSQTLDIFSHAENADALRRAFDFIYPVRKLDWLDKIIHWFSGSKP